MAPTAQSVAWRVGETNGERKFNGLCDLARRLRALQVPGPASQERQCVSSFTPSGSNPAALCKAQQRLLASRRAESRRELIANGFCSGEVADGARGDQAQSQGFVRHARVGEAAGQRAVEVREPVFVPAAQDQVAAQEIVGEAGRSEEHTSELQSQSNLVCR